MVKFAIEESNERRSQYNAVVTPLRKAASYEQRKTNLGSPRNYNVLSRATYYAVLTRASSLPPRIGDTTVDRADFYVAEGVA